MGTGGGGRGPDLQANQFLSLAALADWFMSLGVGLLTFASLETVGIYFGLGKSPAPTLGGQWLDGLQMLAKGQKATT